MKNEVKLHLLELIQEGIRQKVVAVVGDETPTVDNYLTTDYFSLKLEDKLYNVTFKEKFGIPGKHIEYLRRGSIFIKDLLNYVFNNYNLLYIHNATSFFDLKTIVPPPTVHGLVVQPREILHNAEDTVTDEYQYQINFLIDVRDTITGFTTNKKIISGICVRYDEQDNPVYYNQNYVYSDEGYDTGIEVFEPETLIKLRMLTERMKEPEEKERILNAFKKNTKSDLYHYLVQRDEVGIRYRATEIVFDYNVTPIAIYAIKTKMKIIDFNVSYGSTKTTSRLVYNHEGDVKYKCPHCHAALNTKLVFARVDGEEVAHTLACQECAIYLDGKNSVYSDDEWFLKDAITTCTRTIGNELRTLYVLKSDVGLCEIDNIYYYKEDIIVYDQRKISGVWQPNENKHRVHKKYTRTCKNCKRVLVSNEQDGLFHTRTTENAACFMCVNQIKTKPMKREYLLSEISGYCYPASKSVICTNCNRVIGIDETVKCKACKELVCARCHKDEVCNRCQSALKSDLKLNKFPTMWRLIRNNILIGERKKRNMSIDIHQHLNSTNNEIRIVLKRIGRRPILYYFHEFDSKYIYRGRRKL